MERKPGVARSQDRETDVLDSWKEIAAHFDRTVRTVQLWEKREGLPVHRHRHKKRGTVHAYRSELDAWWETRLATLAGDRAPGKQRPGNGLALRALASIGILLVGIVALWTNGRNDRGESDSIVMRRSPQPQGVMLIGRPSAGGRYLLCG